MMQKNKLWRVIDMNKIQNDMTIENELMISLGLIRSSLFYLYYDNGEEDVLFTFLQLASSGFERLLKLIITCDNKNKTGNFCTSKELKGKKLRHNIVSALDFIEKNIDTSLIREKSLDDLLTIFSKFGDYNRYENLNILGGENVISYKDQFSDYAQSIYKNSSQPQYDENEIQQQNIEIIKTLFSLTNDLLILLDKVCPDGKNRAFIYRKQFNNITELLQKFEQKKISIFE